MTCFSYNTLQNNGFTFVLNRLPQTMFRVVACDVPSVQVPAPQAGYPGAMQYFPGMATDFAELNLEFIVDENLLNYEEVFNWITQQRFSDGYVPQALSEEKLVSDGQLITMTNSSNPNRVFYFKDMFPVALGNLHFDTSVAEPSNVICSATFRYSYFELRNV